MLFKGFWNWAFELSTLKSAFSGCSQLTVPAYFLTALFLGKQKECYFDIIFCAVNTG